MIFKTLKLRKNGEFLIKLQSFFAEKNDHGIGFQENR
jgi:hypothetical protein